MERDSMYICIWSLSLTSIHLSTGYTLKGRQLKEIVCIYMGLEFDKHSSKYGVHSKGIVMESNSMYGYGV